MVRFYRDTKTNTIHRVADFPAPRREGYPQCGGKALVLLKEIDRFEARNAPDHEFCLRCWQLAGN